MVERRVKYKASVEGDLRRLDPPTALRVINQIEKTFSSGAPGGKPLAGEFAGLFRLRFGDYRVIYARASEECLVLRIAHRRDIYRRGRP
ncbi:MAG TPA: type II toxin-antitoxin system RelE/ParE family toxin [Thermoanaerobaculia bacterium]|nr:type II toxin-antitoxin system RelE/ParE family toxin [Thermoanaerobaculia bacterium]